MNWNIENNIFLITSKTLKFTKEVYWHEAYVSLISATFVQTISRFDKFLTNCARNAYRNARWSSFKWPVYYRFIVINTGMCG